MFSKIGMPKISIIMPNFNGEKYLERSIQSFIAQNYSNKELIIIDRKSQDKSHSIIEKYTAMYDNIVWLNYVDSGISNAVNKGIEASSGDIIGYLGSDDLLCKGILEEIAWQSEWIDFDAIYFNSYTYYIKGKKCVLRKCPNFEFNKTNLIKYGTIVGLQDIYFKKNTFECYKYNEANKWSFDYELYLDICCSNNFLFLYIDKAATINIFDGNISGSLSDMQTLEALQVAKNHSSTIQERWYNKVNYFKYYLKSLFKFKFF